jgi:hypothetical protein
MVRPDGIRFGAFGPCCYAGHTMTAIFFTTKTTGRVQSCLYF